MSEEFRTIRKHPNYEVNEYGVVRNKKTGHVRKHCTVPKKGYQYISIGGKHCRIHRLVYEAFVGDVPEGLELNHIDTNKLNNHVSNLEAITHQQNIQHAKDNDLFAHQHGEKNPAAKLTQALADEIKIHLAEKKLKHREIAKLFGVCRSTVTHIRMGIKW